MERKRILVAFGDIRGFRQWILRAMNAPEIASDTIDDIYRIFEKHQHQSDHYVKFLGDGFMVIRELSARHSCGLVKKILKDMSILTQEICDRIQMAYPRPDGFRVRIAAGHVWKRVTLTRTKGRLMRHAEYIGYAVNMAQALLYVYPERPCICHESVVEILGPRTKGLTLEHLEPPKERRHGIDQPDFSGLWSFRIDDKAEVRD